MHVGDETPMARLCGGRRVFFSLLIGSRQRSDVGTRQITVDRLGFDAILLALGF